ncbi:MAG: protein kinase [Candidatus Eremiobacterota bacterium]
MYKNCDKCAQVNNVNDLFCIRCGNIFASEDYFLTFYETRIMEAEQLTDRYTLLKTIKSGGMGTIFMALDRNLGKVCAIKELHKSSFVDETSDSELFETEARLLASLQHPGLPRVYDYFTVNGKYYLIMDYIVGDDLLTIMDEHYKDRGVPEEQVIEWAIHLCDVLSYLHNREPPIIYRDLKPANIMIRRADGALVLIDFGIARVSLGDSPSSSHEFVTIGYASPEQCGGKPCDNRSDIYSFGTTIYHLITGYHPRGFSLDPPAKKVKPEISLYMNYVISKAKAMKIKDRYQSVDEIKYALLLWKDPFSVIQSEKGLSDTDLLILQLKSNDIKNRLRAIKALSGIIQEKATVALIKLLSEDDVTLQKQSAIALGEIGDNIAVDELLKLLKSDNKSIRTTAIESLEKIRLPDEEYIVSPWLSELFSYKDSSVRLFAFNLLSRVKYASFYNNLLDGLKDEDHNIRRICAISLSEFGKEDAVEPIKKAIEKEGLFSITTKRVLQGALNNLTEVIKKRSDKGQQEIYTDKETDFKTSLLTLPEQFKDTSELSSESQHISPHLSKETRELTAEPPLPSEHSTGKEGLLKKYRMKVKEGKIKVSRPLFSDRVEEEHDRKNDEENGRDKFVLKKVVKKDLKEEEKTLKKNTTVTKKLQEIVSPVADVSSDVRPVMKMTLSVKDKPIIEALAKMEEHDKEQLLEELSVKREISVESDVVKMSLPAQDKSLVEAVVNLEPPVKDILRDELVFNRESLFKEKFLDETSVKSSVKEAPLPEPLLPENFSVENSPVLSSVKIPGTLSGNKFPIRRRDLDIKPYIKLDRKSQYIMTETKGEKNIRDTGRKTSP